MRKLFSIVFLLSLSFQMEASEFMFRHLEVKDGLSNNHVLDIYKDSEGFMWFATASGLNRYDGNQVKIFLGSEMDSDALQDSYVNDILEDGEGHLWLKTGSGYAIYDPDTETFCRDVSGWMEKVGIEGDPELVFVDRNKNMWFYIERKGCFLYMPHSGKIHSLLFGPQSLPIGTITDISECAEGILLVYGNGRLICLDANTNQIKWVQEDIVKELGGNHSDVFTLFVDRDDDIWMYSPFGMWVYNPVQRNWKFRSCNFIGLSADNNMVHAVTQDQQGRIWIGKDLDGIAIMNKETEELTLLYNIQDDERSLQNNTVMSLYQDDNGTMWVGTYKKGISYYNESTFKFGIKHVGDINCIEEDKQGYVWLGTNDAGLIYWNTVTGNQVASVTSKDGLGTNAVVCMLKAHDGKLWIGTFWGGLDCYDHGKFTHYRNKPGQKNSLVNNNVWSLVEDEEGNIWIGTLGDGIQKLDPKTGTFTSYKLNLLSDHVSSLCMGKDHVLWIGTASGLCAYNLETEKVTLLLNTLSGEKHFSNRNVSQVYEDSRGLVWVGTWNGLNIYNPKTDELEILTVEQGLSNPVIAGITEDDNRTIWVTTARGVTNVVPMMDAKTGHYAFHNYVYGDMDGVQSCEFNQRSIKRLSSGEIMMGGLYGINRFRPDNIKYNKILPNVVFNHLSLFNEEVKIGEEYDGRIVLKKALNRVDKVELNYKQNVFSIQFASDNHILPEKMRYVCKLEGFNDEWMTSTMGRVTYTNLAPGTYTLKVKAINSDGYNGMKEASLKIVIHPPFWLSVWAYIIYALLLVVILMISRRLILRSERNKFKMQQIKQEALKNQEINDMKLRFFTNVSHELRTPLTLIISPLESLMKEYASDDVLVDKLKMVQRNAVRLLNLVTQLLDFRKSDVSGHRLNLSDGDVVSYISNICNSFLSLSEKKDVHLTFYAAFPSLNMAFDEDKIGKVMMNLLSNAFKFTPDGGRVDVALGLIEGKGASNMLEIKVSDTGIGIKDEDKEQIFERFYQVDNAGMNASGSGVGLNLVREFVRLHDGTINVLDNVPKGSVFVVCIPVRKSENMGVVVPVKLESVAKEEGVEDSAVLSDTGQPIAAEKEPTKNATDEGKLVVDDTDNRPIVLMVDDSDDFLTFMYDSLSKNYRVKLASNGNEAWNLLQELLPDIIICDVMMPEMDGNELCRLVRGDRRTANIPFVLLTARHSHESKLEGLTEGADDYITKPFSMDILELRIQKLLDLRTGQHQTHIEPSPSEIAITSMDEKLINHALEYVEANISRSDLSVEELSRELGMSRVHLYKKLLAITGKTPIEFIRVIRLKRAAQLLRESQLNISEIAYQVGYNNPKYFTKYFKEEYGVLPSAYQEKKGK